jgi:hypothetical protein
MEICSNDYVLGGCGLSAIPNVAHSGAKNSTHITNHLKKTKAKKIVDVGRIRTYALWKVVRMMLWCEGERNCLPKGYDF